MRFHLLGLAHVPTNKEYCSCAYTQKIVKLGRMLRSLNHAVFFYGTEESALDCTEFVCVGKKSERLKTYGDYNWHSEFFKHDPADLAHQTFNLRAAAEILARKEPNDFLLIPMGNYQKLVADTVKLNLTVESGIGYEGIFAPYRVFESYGWMHYIYGLLQGQSQNRGSWGDGKFYDTVIPNYYDPTDFEIAPKEDYYLFVGRLIKRKGLQIVKDIAEHLKIKVKVAGQGNLADVEGADMRSPYLEHVGFIDRAQRKHLMARALGLFCPTFYMAPFEGVFAEANMSGTAVITTDWGVFAEHVQNDVNGYRCHTLKEFIAATKHAPNLDSRRIRSYALNRFSLDVVKFQYQRYFERLMDLQIGKGWYQL